jgi:hypothetical protein
LPARADAAFSHGGASSIEEVPQAAVTMAVLSGLRGERAAASGAQMYLPRQRPVITPDVAGIGASSANRIELSYARQRFDLHAQVTQICRKTAHAPVLLRVCDLIYASAVFHRTGINGRG